MGLFGKKKAEANAGPQMLPVTGKKAHCPVCMTHRQFSRCWRRASAVTQCTCCGLVFEDVEALYKRVQPECPQCGEYLEQPMFEYGLCDVCGSKLELVDGTKPGLLPNKKQRAEMAKRGRVWRQE